MNSHGMDVVLTALQHRQGQLSEQEASAMVFRSIRQFRFLFRRNTGVTFRIFRVRIKMECARELLADSSASIDEISERLGYAQRDKFERSFKKSFGITPARYRAALFEKEVFSRRKTAV